MKQIILSILVLGGLAMPALAQGNSVTLTINKSTGAVTVPSGITPNFAALKIGGATIGSLFQPLDADLTIWAGLTPSTNARSLVSASDYAAMRTLLNVQQRVLLGLVTTTESHATMNSTTLADSTNGRVDLAPGTYWIETRQLVGDSDFTNAGYRCKVRFSGTWTEAGGFGERTNQAADYPFNVAPTPAGDGSIILDTEFASSTGYSGYVTRSAKVTVTAAGTAYLQSAQGTANASTHKLYAGSFIKATRID